MDKLTRTTLAGSVGAQVDVITRNGFHIEGELSGFDGESILISTHGQKRIVMLGFVSTIVIA